MRKGKLAFLAFLILSLTFFLSGCGVTNQPPNASFSANPTSGEAPLEVSFDASNSSDPDGSIISYEWDFGDGSTGSNSSTTHTYNENGSFQVTLTVTDDGGLINSECLVVLVGDNRTGVNQPPNANFNCLVFSKTEFNIKCDASSSSDSDGTIVEYNWIFRTQLTDGTFCKREPKSGREVIYNHVSACPSGTPQINDVKLEVIDNDGATDVQTKSYTVYKK